MWFLRLARSSKKFSTLYNMDVELVVTPRSILQFPSLLREHALFCI